jgi:hypothetical protein
MTGWENSEESIGVIVSLRKRKGKTLAVIVQEDTVKACGDWSPTWRGLP